MTSKNIYLISDEYRDLLDEIWQNEGEITPELEERMAINESEMKTKSVNYGFYIKNLEGQNEVIKSEIDRLTELKRRNELNIDRLKGIVANTLLTFNVERIDDPLLKLSLRKSQSIRIIDETRIPSDFFKEKVTRTVDKTAIKEAINKDQVVSGAELEIKYNLQIK